jgi:hypothetical protein
MTRTTNELKFYMDDVMVKETTITYETDSDPQYETDKIGLLCLCIATPGVEQVINKR